MTSLFDVGKSAIQAYRQSLAVTGQNIANINTDGYVRREADLKEVTASQGGITSIANQSGLGVRVADIRRSFDELLSGRKLSASANFEQSDSFLKQVEKLEDLLLPGESDLGSQIGSFFRALNDVAAAPSDLAPRAVAIESGNSLAEAFNSTAVQLEQLKKATLDRTAEAVDTLNTLTKELASVNDKILSASQSGRSPNSLLDLRDKLIEEISKLADITASYTDRGVANVTIGSSGVGPSLISGTRSTNVGFIERYDKIGGLQIILNPLASKTPTSQLSSGRIAGLSEAYGSVRGVIDQINSLAAELSTRLNAQHRLGVALDGSTGGDLFSTISVEAIRSQATSTDVDIELTVIDANKLPSNTLELTYSAETEMWNLSDRELGYISNGKKNLSGPGFEISVSGAPRAGDSFRISPGSNTAGQLEFLIARPHDIAAANPDLVTASNSNLSDAELSMRRISQSHYPDNGLITEDLSNSLSSVEAQEFINDGLITTIPAGTDRFDIASFTTQASAKFHFTAVGLQNINQFSFTRLNSDADGPHTFNIGYSSAYPNDQSGSYWQDAADIANALNNGILKSAANQSLFDLGMRASGSAGNLTFTTSSGDFVATGVGAPEITTGGITNVASVVDAVTASDLQIFTREGRHIAGVAFTDAQITEFMTSANGFDDSAVYTAEYLNNTTNSYRGIDMDVSFAGGMHALKIGSNGIAPALAQGTAIVPANATLSQTMTVTLPDSSSFSIPIDVGASASSAAASFNDILYNSGVRAAAKTQIELFDFQGTGVVSFDLEVANRVPIEISADVTPTNLSNLAIALNKVSSETGVVAVTSTDNTRLILTSDAGDDIAISKLGATSPSFFGRFVDDDGVSETSPIGTVTVSGAFKTPLSSTSAVTDALIAASTVSTNTTSGSGADFNISSDTSGNYTVTINSGGVGAANPYAAGETFTIDGTVIGGTTGIHDVTITVGGVDASGVITSATATGFAPGISQAQTTLTATTTDGSGSSATFDVTLVDGVASIAVNAPGDGYEVGDTITILGSAIGGTDGVNDLTISVATLDPSSLVSFGTIISGNRIDTARFSGSISLSSSAGFTLTETNGMTSSVQNPALGGLVNIHSNVAGDIKRIDYDISDALESGGSTLNGLRAVAPNASYELTVPSSNNSISFTANISSSNLSVIDRQSVNEAIVEEIRNQAPLSSLSAGATVSQTQAVSYSFQRTELVQPNVDSVNLEVNGSIVNVDLNDIDGFSTAASSAADVTAAIVRSINNAGLGVSAATFGTGPNYGVTITADSPGVAFTIEAFEFNDVNETVPQTQFSLTSETPALSLPEDGTTVAINYGGQIYNLAMREGEVTVSGPESDRLTAYFDSDSRLQIFGGGSLSGSPILVVSDTELSGNSDAAEKFGLLNPTTRLTGQLFTLTSSMDDLNFNFSDQPVTVSLDLLGNVTTIPSSITGLTLTWQSETATTGRLKAEYNGTLYSLTFDNPTNALGFKTADREISVSDGEILVSSTDKKAFSLSASAESLADVRFQLSDLPHEDLLIFATGGGARSIGAEYNIAGDEEDLTKYEIRAIGENGNVIEIFDADTNHSIATRVISGDQQTTYRNFEFTLKGRVENGDSFILSQDSSGQNDGRNIDELINLQSGDPKDPSKLSFRDIFGVMIAGVGSSVNSSKIAADIQEENMMAAKEAEAEFSGVNLDTEAAALIEFQQAYQASARILSTARELFQSLMEVV